TNINSVPQRFSWVFFLASKDETSGIPQNFIRQIENQLNHRVKIIRSDNGTEFKNRDMLEFRGNNGIKKEYSNARTPQQNGVAERMNKTLIEAARTTMLANSLLPTTFWAEAVSTACYIFNRVRVTKPQNKTPYELFGNMKRGFRGVPRPLLPAMLPVVVVDQSAGQKDQAVDQPLPSEPLPYSSYPPVISATTESEPTPVAEPTPHPKSPSHETGNKTFEQPSPEHQPLLPRQETKVPQSQDPTHPLV
ncbi:putative ribonuclease H-like domain-containing protein, partial [Tanacetum coccineum]